MAVVSIFKQPPHTESSMSTRRMPLGSNPNAANSPFRNNAAANAKPKRSYATIQREESYGAAPPAKKQIVEVNRSAIRTPPRQTASNALDNHGLQRRALAQPTAFDKKLEAARRRPLSQAAAKAERQAEKAAEENLESIRAWQRHYRKAFPKFVFYFESVPEETRAKFAKQVTSLGAVSSLDTILCASSPLILSRGMRSSFPTLSPTLLPLVPFQLPTRSAQMIPQKMDSHRLSTPPCLIVRPRPLHQRAGSLSMRPSRRRLRSPTTTRTAVLGHLAMQMCSTVPGRWG